MRNKAVLVFGGAAPPQDRKPLEVMRRNTKFRGNDVTEQEIVVSAFSSLLYEYIPDPHRLRGEEAITISHVPVLLVALSRRMRRCFGTILFQMLLSIHLFLR